MIAPGLEGSMSRPLVAAVLTLISGATTAFAQSALSANPSEGLGLLNEAAQRYTDAKSYYIELVEERTSSTEYSHSWQKTVITAAETPENRFHFEGHSNSDSGLQIADGKTVWTYRADEHRFTAKPQLMETSSQPAVMGISEMAMWGAKNLKKNLGGLAKSFKSFKSAQRLPDANLIVSGHEVSCYVVRVQNSDQRRVSRNYTFEKTIWIDKVHRTFMKTAENAHTYLLSDGSHIPIEEGERYANPIL